MKYLRHTHWNNILIRAIFINFLAMFVALSGFTDNFPGISSGIAKSLNKITISPHTRFNSILSIDRLFCDPFGYIGQSIYKPRLVRDIYGNIVENTDYDVNNPDLSNPSSCFGIPMNQLWHAGEDLYDSTGASTQNALVKAVADGYVLFAPTSFNYPGLVVIVEHSLPSGDPSSYVYSVYSHLVEGSVPVYYGQRVNRGQLIGQVLYQEDAPGVDDSHLHFELRTFLDGSNIYSTSTTCNLYGNKPGRGYTYPQHPDVFPNTTQHYIHPSVFILNHQYRLNFPHVAK